MTRINFIHAIKKYTEEVVKDVILPVRQQSGEEPQESRPPIVYCMRIPDTSAATKKAPYILQQIVSASDRQYQSKDTESRIILRTLFCIYWPMPDGEPNEEEGALVLMELMEKYRMSIMRDRMIDDRYYLDMTSDVGTVFYPDDMKPYFIGEITTEWIIPGIERIMKPEVLQFYGH